MSEIAEKVASMLAGFESCGLSRTEIARAAQLSRTTVWRLAVGEYSAPSFDTIARLQALQVRLTPVTDMKQH